MKTMHRFFTIMMALAFLALVSSCKELKELEDLEQIKEPLVSPLNPNNPFDLVGVEHNRGLEHLGQFADSIIYLQTVQNDSVATMQFVSQELIKCYGAGYDLDSFGLTINLASIDSILRANPFDLISSWNLSSDGFSHLNSVFNTIIAKVPESSADVNSITNAIIGLENSIVADSTLPEQESQIILSFTSVFRHSLFFWNSLAFDDGLPWAKIQNAIGGNEKTNDRPWKKWGIIAGADALGALVGGAAAYSDGASEGEVYVRSFFSGVGFSVTAALTRRAVLESQAFGPLYN